MRVVTSGWPVAVASSSLSAFTPSRTRRRALASIPSGLATKKTGSLPPRNGHPWYRPAKYPLCHMRGCGGDPPSRDPDSMTTNSGRSWFSDPRA
jgi:hypothetical protein